MLELWSLFDFLMPGFLGTEKQFQARFGKPILQSRDAKSSSKEQEAGTYCQMCIVKCQLKQRRRWGKRALKAAGQKYSWLSNLSGWSGDLYS